MDLEKYAQELLTKFEERTGQRPTQMYASSDIENLLRNMASRYSWIGYNQMFLQHTLFGLPVHIEPLLPALTLIVSGDSVPQEVTAARYNSMVRRYQDDYIQREIARYTNTPEPQGLAGRLQYYIGQDQSQLRNNSWSQLSWHEASRLAAAALRFDHTKPNESTFEAQARRAIDENKTQVNAKITVPEPAPIAEPDCEEIAKGCRPGITEEDVKELIESWKK